MGVSDKCSKGIIFAVSHSAVRNVSATLEIESGHHVGKMA
jgi:hypothetical protein